MQLGKWSSGLLHFAALLAAARQPDPRGMLTADPIDLRIGSIESRVLAELLASERTTGQRQILASVDNVHMLDWTDTDNDKHVFTITREPNGRRQAESIADGCQRTGAKIPQGQLGSTIAEGWGQVSDTARRPENRNARNRLPGPAAPESQSRTVPWALATPPKGKRRAGPIKSGLRTPHGNAEQKHHDEDVEQHGGGRNRHEEHEGGERESKHQNSIASRGGQKHANNGTPNPAGNPMVQRVRPSPRERRGC